MTYRAVIFDLYWTLLYTAKTGLEDQATALAAEAGAEPEAWRRAWHSMMEASFKGQVSLLERTRMALARAGAKHYDGELPEKLAGLMGARSIPRLYPDVREQLRKVRSRGFKLALLSNIAFYRVNWLKEFELAPHFDALVLSCEMGTMKPDPAMYLTAAERLGLSPQECVFVDDVPPYVAAAQAVGMAGVRINRFDSEEPYAHEDPTDVAPDLAIKDLSQLLEWLGTRRGN
jgi:HAD superfamily hydrolase (TIGR01509 family)